MTRGAEFEQALEELYRVFSAPRPRHIEGCPCCWDSKAQVALYTKPLRELTSKDLDDYTASLFLTAGSASDYFYYLPRIFEICAVDRDWLLSPEIVCDKLTRAGWFKWNKAEQAAILAFLKSWLNWLMVEDDEGSELDALICGLAQADLPLAPWFDALLQNPLSLMFLYEHNAASLDKKGRPVNPFWDFREAPAQEYAAFLQSERVQKLIWEPSA